MGYAKHQEKLIFCDPAGDTTDAWNGSVDVVAWRRQELSFPTKLLNLLK
jgi:hypothetical protein